MHLIYDNRHKRLGLYFQEIQRVPLGSRGVVGHVVTMPMSQSITDKQTALIHMFEFFVAGL